MTLEILAEHEDDDRSLSVSRPRRGNGYQLVFTSSDGLETVIRFDEVALRRASVTFYRRRATGARVETGSVEPDLDAWGGVGEWIQAHADETTEVFA